MEGNQMKMREAVEAALAELDKFGQFHDARIHYSDIVHIGRAKGMLQDALSAPARQCDVGTAEEKYQRWVHFCEQRLHSCHNCECKSPVGCTFKFGDMPYIKEGGKV